MTQDSPQALEALSKRKQTLLTRRRDTIVRLSMDNTAQSVGAALVFMVLSLGCLLNKPILLMAFGIATALTALGLLLYPISQYLRQKRALKATTHHPGRIVEVLCHKPFDRHAPGFKRFTPRQSKYRIGFDYLDTQNRVCRDYEYLVWSHRLDGEIPFVPGDGVLVGRDLKSGRAAILSFPPNEQNIEGKTHINQLPNALRFKHAIQDTQHPSEAELDALPRVSKLAMLRLHDGGIAIKMLLFAAIVAAALSLLMPLTMTLAIPALALGCLGLWFVLRTQRLSNAVTYGTTLPGQITQIQSNGSHHHIRFEYKGFDGHTRQDDTYVRWPEARKGSLPLHLGDRVSVQVDRRNPDVAVLPMFYGKRTAHGQDNRQTLPTPHIDDKALDHTAQAALLDSLHPKRRPAKLGQLTLTQSTLRFETKDSRNTPTLDLNKRFSAHLTATMVDAQRAALHVTLRSQDPDQNPIAFSTHLPQHALSPHIPIQEKHLPFVSPQDFGPLWDTIAAHMRLHANNTWTMLNLTHSPPTPTPSEFTLPSKAQQTTPQTASAAHTHKTTS